MIRDAYVDPLLLATVDELFDGSAANVGEAAEDGAGIPAALWAQAEELGLTRVGLPEEAGGSGGSLHEIVAVLASAARHAVPLPFAETFLAGWLLARAGEEIPTGTLTVALPARTDSLALIEGALRGSVRDVPWGPAAAQVVTIVADPAGVPHVVAFDPASCVVHAGKNLAGEPTAALELSQSPAVCVPAGTVRDEFFWLGAMCRSAQLVGALRAIADMTLAYVGERTQFGKPIGQFQAVQHHVVTVVQAAEIAEMALSTAARAWSRAGRPRSFETCAAKLVANESARVSGRASHQAHGAMGMTREYPLHLHTRRLHVWRHQFGTERQLASSLGVAASAAPSFSHLLSDSIPDVVVVSPVA